MKGILQEEQLNSACAKPRFDGFTPRRCRPLKFVVSFGVQYTLKVSRSRGFSW